jgi:hypothetical protein
MSAERIYSCQRQFELTESCVRYRAKQENKGPSREHPMKWATNGHDGSWNEMIPALCLE